MAGQSAHALEQRYLVWGIFRLALGLLQMTFAAAAILRLVFSGLSTTVLWYAAAATLATIVSRFLFGGRSGPGR